MKKFNSKSSSLELNRRKKVKSKLSPLEASRRKKIKLKLSPLELNRHIDYKDIILLRSFTTSYGKILGRRITRLTKIQQKEIKKAIKHARLLGLFPFVPQKAI